MSGLEENGLDLLDAMLVYNPARRISARRACEHPYFGDGSANLGDSNQHDALEDDSAEVPIKIDC